ncbi:MAG: hypothetical protein K8R57_04975, partial [Verrucomicrobia bacterium]|nr:hypothetical protein [Verrucomicrobiota bacterium]
RNWEESREGKGYWMGRRLRARIPLRALTEQATPPDGVPCPRPKGWGAFPLGLRWIRQGKPAAGIATALPPWPSWKIPSNATLPNFFTRS